MPLQGARRKQLDDIVTKMDSEGASSDEIKSVVNDFVGKYGNEPDQSTPPPQANSGEVPVGVIGGIGSAVASGAPAIRSAVHTIAGVVRQSPFAQRIAGYLGGMGGATAAGAVGGPGAGTMGGIGGYHFVRSYARPIAKAVEAATDTGMPRTASGAFGALPPGRRLVNAITNTALPLVGKTMLGLDTMREEGNVGQRINSPEAMISLARSMNPVGREMLLRTPNLDPAVAQAIKAMSDIQLPDESKGQ